MRCSTSFEPHRLHTTLLKTIPHAVRVWSLWQGISKPTTLQSASLASEKEYKSPRKGMLSVENSASARSPEVPAATGLSSDRNNGSNRNPFHSVALRTSHFTFCWLRGLGLQAALCLSLHPFCRCHLGTEFLRNRTLRAASQAPLESVAFFRLAFFRQDLAEGMTGAHLDSLAVSHSLCFFLRA